jgi:ABC-2 type transport system permease protein
LLIEFTALGGFFFFCLAISWLFGREFTDGTLKDLLAVPVPRFDILLAKFIVSALWCATLIVETYVVGLALGALIRLPGGSPAVILHGTAILALILGNLSMTLGWGEYFPWAIAGMYLQEAHLPLFSYLIVILTGVVGVTGTYLWWKYADQNR